MVPEIWSATDIIFCRFGFFFCPFTPPQQSKKPKFKQQQQQRTTTTTGDIIILHMFTKNYDHRCTVAETEGRTDGETDIRTKKVTYRGGCPT